MAKTEDDGGIGAEVSSRLDELFSEDDEQDGGVNLETLSREEPEKTPPRERVPDTVDRFPTEDESADKPGFDDSPIGSLKALVSEIEWEITDDTMNAFLREINSLKQKHQDDPILVMFLKLHESIGKYIRSRKVKAHPEAVKFITNLFLSFDKVANTPLMPASQKKKLLFAEMKRFKELKQRLIKRKQDAGDASRDRKQAAGFGDRPVMPLTLDNKETLDYLADYLSREMKKAIRDEFEKIRLEAGKFSL